MPRKCSAGVILNASNNCFRNWSHSDWIVGSIVDTRVRACSLKCGSKSLDLCFTGISNWSNNVCTCSNHIVMSIFDRGNLGSVFLIKSPRRLSWIPKFSSKLVLCAAVSARKISAARSVWVLSSRRAVSNCCLNSSICSLCLSLSSLSLIFSLSLSSLRLSRSSLRSWT